MSKIYLTFWGKFSLDTISRI